LEDWDRVWEVEEKWVEKMRATKGDQSLPMLVSYTGAWKNDAGYDLVLDNTEAIAESISDFRLKNRQQLVCGKAALKWDNNSESDRHD
jgi:hypothetical protein